MFSKFAIKSRWMARVITRFINKNKLVKTMVLATIFNIIFRYFATTIAYSKCITLFSNPCVCKYQYEKLLTRRYRNWPSSFAFVQWCLLLHHTIHNLFHSSIAEYGIVRGQHAHAYNDRWMRIPNPKNIVYVLLLCTYKDISSMERLNLRTTNLRP